MRNKFIKLHPRDKFLNSLYLLNPDNYSIIRTTVCFNIQDSSFIIKPFLKYNLFNNNSLQQYKDNL